MPQLKATYSTPTGCVLAEMVEETLTSLNLRRREWLQRHFPESQIRSGLIPTDQGIRERLVISHPDGSFEMVDIRVQKVPAAAIAQRTPYRPQPVTAEPQPSLFG